MIGDFTLFGVIVAADRISKMIVPRFLDLYESIPVIPGLFDITYARNSGGAFGILASWDSPLRRVFFILASVAAMFLLWVLYRQAAASTSRSLRLSFAAIGGGAFGNLYDRAVTGEVVDFLDFYLGSYHWPAFNIADSAISIGAVILGYLYLTGKTDTI
ncbi:MAG: signal peptidase II [bacterium]|nr:signal peptidase II [bacterium]MDT8394917.1 signal peptidase II [bacterium]